MLRERLSFKLAINTMIIISLGTIMYQSLILVGFISYDAVWGGQLENKTQMYQFVSFAIIVNLLILVIILIRGSILNFNVPNKPITILLYLFTVLFIFNTIGNLFSENLWETIVFTPVTLISAILCYRLATEAN